jgi:ubiquinone/menaquinone biosynthesis C-methylase UbiE
LPLRVAVLALAILASSAIATGGRTSAWAQAPSPGRLTAPAELGLLEAPDRHEWQQPNRIMDALRIADGDRVADVGAGGGWFTIRLARTVGPNGRVYAEDIQPLMIESIQRRIQREGLTNVEVRLGTAEDPRLPTNLQAVLMCDVYSQLPKPVVLLRKLAASLAPNGLLGIVDFKTDGAGGPGPALAERVAPEIVIRDAVAAGLVLRSRETFLKYQYFLIFGRS